MIKLFHAIKLISACIGVFKMFNCPSEALYREFYQISRRHIQNCQIALAPGTVRKTPSPNKQPLSRPGSAGGTPGTVLR